LGWVGCARRQDGRRDGDRESGELRVRWLSGRTSEVVEFCAGLPGPTRVAYEAGPTGFTLARALERAGIGCVIAAPGKIERLSQDRVKIDRRVRNDSCDC
jgi:transposase